MFCTNDFKGNNLEFCPLPITEYRKCVKYLALHNNILCLPVLESSRTSPRLRGSSRTILALRVESLALALRLVSLTPSLALDVSAYLFTLFFLSIYIKVKHFELEMHSSNAAN